VLGQTAGWALWERPGAERWLRTLRSTDLPHGPGPEWGILGGVTPSPWARPLVTTTCANKGGDRIKPYYTDWLDRIIRRRTRRETGAMCTIALTASGLV